jgi:hypothetical protein
MDNLVFRTIPKSGSQSISKLVSSWPNVTKCPRKEHRSKPPFVFTFVRHPFSRLVSGFHTIMTMLGRMSTPGAPLFAALGKSSAALFQLPFWRAFEAMAGSSNKPVGIASSNTPASIAGNKQQPTGVDFLVSTLSEEQVRHLFRLFVRDVLSVDGPLLGSGSGGGADISNRSDLGVGVGGDGGGGSGVGGVGEGVSGGVRLWFRNGVDPVLHHIHSQTYFMGLRFVSRPACNNNRDHNNSTGGGDGSSYRFVCSPRFNFVGRLEDTSSHLGLMLEHLAPTSPFYKAVYDAWRQDDDGDDDGGGGEGGGGASHGGRGRGRGSSGGHDGRSRRRRRRLAYFDESNNSNNSNSPKEATKEAIAST